MRRTPYRPTRTAVTLAVTLTALGAAGCSTTRSAPAAGNNDGEVKVGLVTKTETNPYFVKLRQSAQAEAKKQGASLVALAGKFDGDNAGQVTAIENLVQQQVDGILITPSNAKAILNAIKDARDAGVVVIALDTETDPRDAVAATYATDNEQAGETLGKYIHARLGQRKPKVLMADLDPSSTVGVQRHNGFLKGMGLTDGSKAIIGSALTQGDQSKAQSAMENLLQRVGSKVNVVYNINEPAARGSYLALKERGLAGDVLVGAIDGSCSGVKDVAAGKFAATVMQFPKKMAEQGVDAVVKYAKDGTKPSGFINTGDTLITDKPVDGMESQDTTWGAAQCWG